MGNNLKNDAIKGARWGTIENFSSLGITFIVGIVLSWLLTPYETGLIGSLTIFIAISISFIDNGFSSAIIRKSNPSQEDLSTAFISNFLISIICFLVLYIFAPLIGAYFRENQLIPILRTFSFVLIINAISIVQRALLVKNLLFKELTICTLSSSILSGCIGVFLAFKGFGVWSLVWQQISKQAVNSIMLWIIGKWRFTFCFKMDSFKELFSYGSKILISGILDTFFKNLYYPVIGRYFSITDLGQYTKAEQFSNVTTNNLSQIIQRVTFPVLSKVANSTERLNNAFRTMIKTTILISSILCFWLSAVSIPFITGLIGEKWLDAAKLLSILSYGGVFIPLHYLNQNLLQIIGDMKLYLKLEIVKKVILTISIIIGLVYGLTVLMWGAVFSSVITYLIFAYYGGKRSGYSVIKQILDIIPPILISYLGTLICGIASYYAIYLIKNYTNIQSTSIINLSGVGLGSLLGIGLIVLFYTIFPRKEWQEVKNLINIFKK